jgi:hypothetical protein
VSALTGVGRTSYLVITAGRLVYKVLVVQGMQWAYSNIILKDGKLTFATTAAENAEIPANVEGLAFKWGSLIGMHTAGAQGTPYTSDRISFIPEEYTGSTPITVYGNIPYASVDAEFDSYNALAATGDICRYVSAKGWVQGKWRMPTQAEALKSIDCGYKIYGSFELDFTWPETDGTHLSPGGIFLGTTDDDPSYLTGDMPIGAMFLPTGGAITGNGTAAGTAVNVGTLARFWTTTMSDETYAYNLISSSTAPHVTADGALKTDGREVRCIRDMD